MAEIRRWFLWRHLRSESTSHILFYRNGSLVRGGRGLAFWFFPWSASVTEVPCDDRDLPFLFHARSADFQDVTTQGVITYRVEDSEKLAARVDFSVDLRRGAFLKTPLDQLAQILTQLAQQFALNYVAQTPVREVLSAGLDPIRERIREGLKVDAGLGDLGLRIVSVRVSDIAPTAELEKALQTPTREAIQQSADEATFQRRALAVDKERAIQENELQNRIELTRREEALIRQRGANDRLEAEEVSEAEAITAKAEAERKRLEAQTQAKSIQLVEEARVGAEREKMAVYKELPPPVLLGLAAQEFAGKLNTIEHLNVAPDFLGPFFTRLVEAGTRYLDAGAAVSKGE
jgi:regulator of protease activity HflC (stomatin/prohibitin superfamily)